MPQPWICIRRLLFAWVGMALVGFGSATRAAEPAPVPHLVFLIGEEGYRTGETLPEFIQRELASPGFRTTIIRPDPNDPNHFPGLDALKKADLLVLSVRRRTLPEAELALIRGYLEAGKPLVALRTSSHAFALSSGSPPANHAQWADFDVAVLGGRYAGDLPNQAGTDVSIAPGAEKQELLAGLPSASFHSAGSLYKSVDLGSKTTVLLRGQTVDQGQAVSYPVAWTNRFQENSRVFYTSLGHPDDFKLPAFNRLLSNAIHWALNRPAATKKENARDKYKDGLAANEQVERMIRSFQGKGVTGDESLPTSPAETLKKFQVADDLELQLLASEPAIRQPLDLTWDQRGRLWVVQYLQYPFPAGLKVVKYDQYLRAVFDKVPPPPPHHVPGADKVTVLEDTDGDGSYDKIKDVLTGLNIVSSVLVGRGGIWVLNPPYLLFYPDADGNDVPDADPTVHLSGFGLEDTHSVTNNLEWGPDGWIYGANGSTTTGTINSAVTKNVHFKGQMIWRYHPETKVFEIYAEGGGNTFSLEIDSVGRVFSGTNGGNTRGMHYVQGGYAEKNWGKHGPLTNPYAFGYYHHMLHEGFPERFSQTFAIYEGGAFPPRYNGTVISADALHNRVLASRLLRDTSTYRTVDLPPIVVTNDRWFRPVDLEVGPDGAVYMADWYDSRLSHVDPRDNWHKESGRLYRLQAKGSRPIAPFNLAKLSGVQLVDMLKHSNKWQRRQALLLLGDRHDETLIPQLRKLAGDDENPHALDALWALNLSGKFDEDAATRALGHRDPNVRRWAIRLLGDGKDVSDPIAGKLTALAQTESDRDVRSQLASSAKRLPASKGLPIVRVLLARTEDIDDKHIPLLLWWALEAKTESDREAVRALFQDKAIWRLPIVDRFVLERLMQRYAMAGGPENLETCAQLLAMSPGQEQTTRLMVGLMEAFRGRKISGLPPALAEALDKYQQSLGKSDLALGLRLGKAESVEQAIKIVADERADRPTRLAYIEILGQLRQPKAVGVLKNLLATSSSHAIKRVALEALMNYDDPTVGQVVLRQYHSTLPDEQALRSTAHRLLASRKNWTVALLNEIDASTIDHRTIPMDIVQQMRLHHDPQIDRRIDTLWGKTRATPAETQKLIQRLQTLVRDGRGDLSAGREVFTKNCATCHKLFGEGGDAGPDLTGYERTNLDFLLLAIADPSAAIREEFTNFAVFTNDGRTLSGLIHDQNTRTVTLRGVDNQTTLVNRDEIETLQALPISLMPDGLMTKLTDPEIRNLFAYLMSRAPEASLAKPPGDSKAQVPTVKSAK
ncbi:HEAT repeat domain-containing protein [Singulisphaera sp. Ch08]|uniref:HEAT repeat domain-containing protein n=1 Tax=Singulisphaera sp. Ch08 TaxID=3120278 RepID=A0AAU7CDP7_9BACT